jgi:hypothetical protein
VSTLLTYKIPAMVEQPDWERFSRYFSELGRKGGNARAKKLTPEQRKEIATKASQAAAEVRRKKAAQRRSAKRKGKEERQGRMSR